MELLWKNEKYGVLATRIDKKILKRLIARGKATITTDKVGISYSRTIVVATVPKPAEEVVDTGGPYAKRKASLIESEMPFRGKTWGKVRVDLPREERERSIKEKQLMWKKLTRHTK